MRISMYITRPRRCGCRGEGSHAIHNFLVSRCGAGLMKTSSNQTKLVGIKRYMLTL